MNEIVRTRLAAILPYDRLADAGSRTTAWLTREADGAAPNLAFAVEICAGCVRLEWGSRMSVRLVVTINAAPGKGSELAQIFRERCLEVMKEPGCEHFEVFQSVLDPDKLALLELWTDQAALDVHAGVNATRAPLPEGLRAGSGSREDYIYNRTR